MQTSTTLQLQISPAQIIAAVQSMNKDEQQAFVEDLLAAVSPEHLDSLADPDKNSALQQRLQVRLQQQQQATVQGERGQSFADVVSQLGL